MKLTSELKAEIDGKSVYDLLHRVRFGPIGDTMFQDESAAYWLKRLSELRAENPDAFVAASKAMGWEK